MVGVGASLLGKAGSTAALTAAKISSGEAMGNVELPIYCGRFLKCNHISISRQALAQLCFGTLEQRLLRGGYGLGIRWFCRLR